MKKLLILSVTLGLIFSSCGKKEESGGLSARAKKNMEASRTVSKAFLSGDVSGIDSVVADNFVDHTPQGDYNRDSLKAMITQMHQKNTDMTMETLQEFANDDYCFSWYRFKGTSDGSMGMPKGPYDFKSIEVVKFNADSKAIEHWEYMDVVEMMKMMQSMPPATTTTGTDTTAHQ